MNIFEAARRGNLEELKKLIKDGADLNAKDDWGRTAMMWAAWSGHTDCVELLKNKGAK